jgi:hypothetical protein
MTIIILAMKKINLLFLPIILVHSMVSGTTYYSQGSITPEVTSNWNDIRAGGGNSPMNFTSGDVFVVQNSHAMSGEANWTISGSGSKLWIENGGILQANFPVTLAKATIFQIDDGGMFIHNNAGIPSSTIFNGIENFAENSTYWIKSWIGNLYVIPYGISWGNLIVDIPALSGSWNQVGNVATVRGTLDVRQTGGNELRLCSRTTMTYTFNIANINVSGGILNIQGGGTSGIPTITTIVSGNISVSGGILDMGTNGSSSIRLSGDLMVSGTGTILNSGTTSKILFDKTGTQNVCLTTGAMNTSLISADINPCSTVNMNSGWALSPLATINIYGILNTNNNTFKARAINVGGSLNLGTGVLEQIGTAAIIVGGPSLGNTGIINCSGVINMAASSYGSFLIQPGGVVNLNNGVINMNHSMSTFFIDTGGTLNCGSGKVKSINSTMSTFIINPGGALTIGSPDGITLEGPTGNIQVGGTRSYHYGANYCYNGTSEQVTGNGLPSAVNDLTINNESGVSLTSDLFVNGTFHLITGPIIAAGKILSYGENGNLVYDGSFYTATSDVEFPSLNGPHSLRINNSPLSGLTLHADQILTGSLTIADSKKFIIPSGIRLTVNGPTILNGNDCMEIMSDGSFIDNGTPSEGIGTAIVSRYITADSWHYISSPVHTGFSGIFTSDYIKPYAEGTLGFGPTIVSPNILLKPTQGYAVWTLTDQTVNFEGEKLNTGAQETQISRTYTGLAGNDEYDGWNLIGNPYPCAIDLDLVHETWENVEETAYFWDQSLSYSGNYTVYPAKAGFGTHSQYVPAMQGFFVRCNANASHETPGFGIIRFNDSGKVHSSEIFLKGNQHLSNTLVIKVTGSANTFSDKLVVHFDQNTSSGYDPGFDGYKLWGLPDAPQIYTTMTGDANLAINALPFENPTIVIPMGFKSGITGLYELEADSLGTFGEEFSIILQDLKLNISQNLKSISHYSFSYEQNDLPERFQLRFNNSSSRIIECKNSRSVKIYSTGSILFIENFSGQKLNGTVFIYDLAGRELFQTSLQNKQINSISPGFGQGYFIVKVVSPLGVFNQCVSLN